MNLKKQIKEVNTFFEKMEHNELFGVEYLTRLDEFIKTHPKNAYAHFLKGQKTVNTHYVDKAIRLYPEYFEAYLLRGKILRKKYKRRAFDDFKTVLKLLNKANKIDSSELAEIYSFLAEYEMEVSENLSKAFEYIGKALETISKYEPFLKSKYYFQRARLYLSFLNNDSPENKLNNALNDLNTAINLDPIQNQFYLVRGNVKLKLGDHEGYENDIELCKNELFLFQDKEGKKLFKKNLVKAPHEFDWNNKLKRKCPICNSGKIAFYNYEIPDFENMTQEEKDMIDNGEEILAKNKIFNVDYICRDCGTQWSKKAPDNNNL